MADPNVSIQESKAFTVNDRSGAHEQGAARGDKRSAGAPDRRARRLARSSDCAREARVEARVQVARDQGGQLMSSSARVVTAEEALDLEQKLVEDGASKRKGFFTDTTLCIGCKACEVACKQWNQLPDDGFNFSGMSYDNTVSSGSVHVASRGVHRAAGGAVESRCGARFRGCFPPTCASIARAPDVWKLVPPARSCARNSTRSTCSRTFAMAAAIAWSTARSA